jgi:hypothetical protein
VVSDVRTSIVSGQALRCLDKMSLSVGRGNPCKTRGLFANVCSASKLLVRVSGTLSEIHNNVRTTKKAAIRFLEMNAKIGPGFCHFMHFKP